MNSDREKLEREMYVAMCHSGGPSDKACADIAIAYADRRVAEAVAAYGEAMADHRKLVRQLDVALNGEAGAAKQASLCDIVGQVEDIRRHYERTSALSPAREGGQGDE